MQNKNFKKFSATLVSAIFLGSCSAQNVCFSKTNSTIIQHFDSSSSDYSVSDNNSDGDKSVDDSNLPTVLEEENENSTSNTTVTSKILQFIVKAARTSGNILLTVYKWLCYFIGTANMIVMIPFIMTANEEAAKAQRLKPGEFIERAVLKTYQVYHVNFIG